MTIAGVASLPTGMDLTFAGQPCETRTVALKHGAGVLYVSGLDEFTPDGAWEGEMEMKLYFEGGN